MYVVQRAQNGLFDGLWAHRCNFQLLPKYNEQLMAARAPGSHVDELADVLFNVVVSYVES